MTTTWPRIGRAVYGAAAIALGLVGLRWGDFASPWQPVPPNVPYRATLAYVAAVALLLAGIATLRRSTARLGAVVLGVVYVGVAIPWLVRVVRYPQLAGTWLGFCEQLALVVACVVYGSVDRPVRRSTTAPDPALVSARVLLGLCALAFGLAHFAALRETAAMVPAWLPPGQRFWALATGAFHLLAAAALITGIRAQFAARLLTLMLLGFGALVWLPMLAADPTAHMRWAGNAVNLAIAGAVWVVADALAASRSVVHDDVLRARREPAVTRPRTGTTAAAGR